MRSLLPALLALSLALPLASADSREEVCTGDILIDGFEGGYSACASVSASSTGVCAGGGAGDDRTQHEFYFCIPLG